MAEAMLASGGAVDAQTAAMIRQIDAAAKLNKELKKVAQDPVKKWIDAVPSWTEAGPVKSIKKGFKAAAAAVEAGLPDVSPHVLRHTAAVHMAEAGISMDEIAQYLGHSDSRITASTYARYSPEHLRKAASALEFG